MDFRQLVDLTEAHGLGTVRRNIGRHHGRYLHSKSLILLSERLTGPQSVSIFAHEIGHWHYGDCDPEGIQAPAAEERAWRFAAALLLNPYDIAVAQQATGTTHLGAVAAELGVTRQLLEAFRPGLALPARFLRIA